MQQHSLLNPLVSARMLWPQKFSRLTFLRNLDSKRWLSASDLISSRAEESQSSIKGAGDEQPVFVDRGPWKSMLKRRRPLRDRPTDLPSLARHRDILKDAAAIFNDFET